MRILILETIERLTPESSQVASSSAIAKVLKLDARLVESHLTAMIERDWLSGQRSFRGWVVELTNKTRLFLETPSSYPESHRGETFGAL